MEAPNFSATEWRFTEVLASEDAMYVLWLIDRGLNGTKDTLINKIRGKPGRAQLVIDELLRDGFLQERNAVLILGELGKKALVALFGDAYPIHSSVARAVNLPIRHGDLLRVKQIKSSIGHQKRQQRTLTSLGLRRINQEVNVAASRETIGMVNSIPHLVRIVSTHSRNHAFEETSQRDLTLESGE